MTTAESLGDVSTVDTLLWVVLPYVCLAVFVVGHCWRYRYDKFGWTTRSSQLYESRLLRLGSPLFHFGILFVIARARLGLGVPQTWTETVGVSEGMYHASAVGVGIGRRGLHRGGHGHPHLPAAHRRAGLLGHHADGQGDVRRARHRHRARAGQHRGRATSSATTTTAHGVSIWFRGIFRLDPHPSLMAAAPIGFQLHALAAFALFALWPFTRLVHVFSAPLGYLTRPYIVYRCRDAELGSRKPRRGWERVG